jgi:hypothetical protein
MEPTYSLLSSQEPTTGIQSRANGIEVTSPHPPSTRIALHVFRARYRTCTKSAGFCPNEDYVWLLSAVIIASSHWTRPSTTAWTDRYRAVPLILGSQALVAAVNCLPLCSDERWMDVVLYCRWKDGPLSTLTHIVWKENENTDTGKNVRLVVFPVKPATKSQLKQESLRM